MLQHAATYIDIGPLVRTRVVGSAVAGGEYDDKNINHDRSIASGRMFEHGNNRWQ